MYVKYNQVMKVIKSGKTSELYPYVLLGSGNWFFFQGQIYFAEILLVIYLMISRRSAPINPQTSRIHRNVSALFVVSIASQILSDVVRETSPNLFFKGFRGLLFTFSNFLALKRIIEKRAENSDALIFGFAIGSIVGALTQPNIYVAQAAWKFGYSIPVTLLVLLYLSREKKHPLLRFGLLSVLAFVDFYFEFRSLAGITLLTAAINLRASQLNDLDPKTRRISGFFPKEKRLVRFFSIGFLALIVYIAYLQAGSLGLLTQNLETKFQNQNSNQFGIIAGGRPEFIGELTLIRNSPVIGYGSYASLTPETRELLARTGSIERVTQESFRFYFNKGLLPIHSVLFEFWIFFGLGAALLIFYILKVAIVILAKQNTSPLLTFLVLLTIWDTIFSPFGAARRISYILFFLYMVDKVYRDSAAHLQK